MAKLDITINALWSGVKKGADGVASSIKGIGRKINGAMGAIGVGLSAAGIIAYGKKIIDIGDQIAENSKRIGVSAEEYQKLKFAAEQSGSSMENLEVAFAKMFSVIDKAKDPSSKAAQSLGRLGLSFKDLDGKTAYEQMKLVMAGLKGIQNTGERIAIGKEVLGRGSREFNELANNFDELTAKAGESGLMTAQAAEAANELGHALERLDQTLIAAASESGFIEYLKSIVDIMEAIIKLNSGMAGKMGIETKDEAIQRGVDKARSAAGDNDSFTSVLKNRWITIKALTNPESFLTDEDKKKFTGRDNITEPITGTETTKGNDDKKAREEAKRKADQIKKETADEKMQMAVEKAERAIEKDMRAARKTKEKEVKKAQKKIDNLENLNRKISNIQGGKLKLSGAGPATDQWQQVGALMGHQAKWNPEQNRQLALLTQIEKNTQKIAKLKADFELHEGE